MLKNADIVAQKATALLKTASILNINTILTEQYPKGLGSTIDEILSLKEFKTVEKTTFSALQTQEFMQEINKIHSKNIVIFGIETHICVLQSVLDLLNLGFSVFVVSDCCSSRAEDNHLTALNYMASCGANIVTLEMVLFGFLKSSKHEKFKEIQGLIK
jgi:isochorismate hydrolase